MTRTYLCYIVNIMGADVLATQGARASTSMLFAMFNQIIGSPHVKGYIKMDMTGLSARPPYFQCVSYCNLVRRYVIILSRILTMYLHHSKAV